jgi:GNAT superfamily N-acetyltransferase
MKLEFRTVPFEQWREKFFGEHVKDYDHHAHITPCSNNSAMIRYLPKEIYARTILIPLCMKADGVDVAWTCPFNVSDTSIRMRGTIVPDEFRGRGYGRMIINHAMGMWPRPWNTCLIWTFVDKIGFYERCGFSVAPRYVSKPLQPRIRSVNQTISTPDVAVLMMKRFNRD